MLDAQGESVGLSRYLLDCCDRVTVITDNMALYRDEAALMLEEKGAVLRVTCSRSVLANADVIISRACIDEHLGVKPSCVIFTSQKPAVNQGCTVFFKYYFDLSEKYERIRPPFLEPMYFAEALYTMAGAYELGCELFRFCSDGVTVHTRGSLKDFLKKVS